MYVVTNREIVAKRKGLSQFGKRLSEKGANELRVAKVSKSGASWNVKVLPDNLNESVADRLIRKHKLPLKKSGQFASLRVACDVVERARAEKKNVLFFVHGYNNDMKDIVTRAADFEKRYNVICIVFSWPANGGGVSGAASYKSDKRDARASAGALERTLMIMYRYFDMLAGSMRERLYNVAMNGDRRRKISGFKDNGIRRDELYAQLLEEECPFTVNAIFHSMGNYVLKQSMKSSLSEGNQLLFDNISLVAADTNNLDHDLWVEKLAFRNRCFIAINEKDFALGASRAKAGSQQLARLGHYLRNLTASNAHYINFTGAEHVGRSHGYFSHPPTNNKGVEAFFDAAFNGRDAEKALSYNPAGNWYDL